MGGTIFCRRCLNLRHRHPPARQCRGTTPYPFASPPTSIKSDDGHLHAHSMTLHR
jgi:hypothetical protein